MKKLFLVLLALPFLMSCNCDSKSTEKNIALVEKYIQSVEDMDYKTMESLLDDSYYGHGPSFNDSASKKQVLASWKYNTENLYEEIEYKKEQHGSVIISKGLNKGEWISSWAELFITYKTGETVTIWANTAYKVENDKIVKSYTFYNEADALEQLGYVFINPDDL